MRSVVLVVTVLVLVLALAARAVDDDITCNQSGMCSVGKSKYFYGSVQTSEGFLAAMEAVSYKREVVLVTTYGSYYLEFVFQLHSQFKRLGIAHFMTLSMKEDGCREVALVGQNKKNISCGWDDSPQHGRSWGGGPLLWHLRWKFLARAARTGYNVLSLDSDFMVLQDPYVFLHRPPFNKASLLGVNEHGCGMNGGFAYIHNASVSGPVSWLFHHTTEVPLRWMDDDMKLIESWGKMQAGGSQMCMTFDQSFLDDSLHSTMAGRPITKTALGSCLPDDWKGIGGATKGSAIDKQKAMVHCNMMKGERVPMPPSFLKTPSLPDHFFDFQVLDIQVPTGSAGTMPDELGGPLYSTKGGKYSDAYLKQLRGDCTDEKKCPWWGDESGAGSEKETMGFVPHWLSTSASLLNHGYLTPVDGSRPRQVMFHFHVLPFVRNEWKAAVAKIYGAFDWKLSKFLHQNEEADKKLAPGPYMCGKAPRRVIALSPNIDLSQTRSLREFKTITAGLVQMALLSGRAVVYPDMPCNTTWVHKDTVNGAAACDKSNTLLQLTPESMPYAARVKPTDQADLRKEYRICSAFLADKGCLGPNGFVTGMLNVEFEEWVHNDLPKHNANGPWKGNTFMHFDRARSAGASGYVFDEMVLLNEEEATNMLSQLDGEDLIYLGHPMAVNMSDGEVEEKGWKEKFNKVLLECRGLYYTPYMVDQTGAAKPSDYLGKLPLASIVHGNILRDNGVAAMNRTARMAAEEKYTPHTTKVLGCEDGSASCMGNGKQSTAYKGNVTAPVLTLSTEGCEGSGMCSASNVTRYFGTVRTGKGLQAAFDAVSYKKELILVTTYGVHYVEFVFQLYSQFRRLGMDHFLALSMNVTGCKQLDQVARGYMNISCGWDDSPQHRRSWGGGPRLWHLRWKFMARAARKGYNILSLDSDYMVMQDPYVFLKAPPLSDYQLMGVEEHGCGMNGGYVYIQNTKPNGPVAWLFHRTTEVPLRWMDDDMAFIDGLGKMKPTDGMCLTFDQSFLDDALSSVMLGQPITYMILLSCTLPGWKANVTGGATHEDAMARQRELVGCVERFKGKSMGNTPKAWPPQPKLPSYLSDYRVTKLRVPNPQGKPDPPEFGGPMFTRAGGKYSDNYFTQLKEDCPDCPPFMDEKEEDYAAAMNNTENFAFVPKWLAASAAGLNHGYLTPPDGSKPRQVMVHFHVLSLASREWKSAVAKIFGHFDWELSRWLHSDATANAAMLPGPYISGLPAKRVIALHPSVDLSKTRNFREYNRIVAGLVQLALMSGRSIVYPDLPCNTMWVHTGGDTTACTNYKTTLKLSNAEYVPYAARVAPHTPSNTTKAFRVVNAFFADRGCLGPNNDKVTGMLNVEYEEWLARDSPAGATLGPEVNNTIFFEPPNTGTVSYLVDRIVQLMEVEVYEELTKYDSEEVLYVGRPVLVDMSGWKGNMELSTNWKSKFSNLLMNCHGIYWAPKGLDTRGFQSGHAKITHYIYGPLASIANNGTIIEDLGRQALAKTFAALPCNSVGLCSMGWTKPFYGPVTSSVDLKDALEAVSYKKELIVFPLVGRPYLELALQANDNLVAKGMTHGMALSTKEDWCSALKDLGGSSKAMQCGWDVIKLKVSGGSRAPMEGGEHPLALALIRIKFLARASRLGYSVMMLDPDAVMLQDPYPMLKSGPMALTLLIGSSSPPSSSSSSGGGIGSMINGAFMYIQNASANGPVAHALQHAVYNLLRRMDDSPTLELGNAPMCSNVDALLLTDALNEVISGKSVDSSTEGMLAGCTGGGKLVTGSDMVGLEEETVALPATWPAKPTFPASLSTLKRITLMLPDKVLPTIGQGVTKKPLSDLFLSTSKSDSDEPWWKVGAFSGVEVMGLLPQWMVGSITDLNHGLIKPADGSVPRQMVLHLHTPNFTDTTWKVAAAKTVGAFNWQLNKFLRDDDKVAGKMTKGPYFMGKPHTMVLKLSNLVNLTRLKSQEDFIRISIGLLQLSIISERTVVYPDIPCSAQFLVEGRGSISTSTAACEGRQLLSLPPHLIPYGSLEEPTNAHNPAMDTRLSDAHLYNEACLNVARTKGGMTMSEFEEWIAQDAPKHTANGPWGGNTVFKTEVEEGLKGSHYEDPVMLSEDEVGQEMEKYKGELLLYVGRPLLVDMSGPDEGKLKGWRAKFMAVLKGCKALRVDPTAEDITELSKLVSGPKATLDQRGRVDEDSIEKHQQ